MCGRFSLMLDPGDLEQQLDLESVPGEYVPRYNIAPSQPVWVLNDVSRRELTRMRWGLIPSWAKDPSISNRLINARSETINEKPSFRQAFLHRRCLIPADGFYEWLKFPDKRPSQPYHIHLKDRRAFFFAGLWEAWQPGVGQEKVLSCTIITCAANELMRPIHDRMPVILTRDQGNQWLEDIHAAGPLMQPFKADEMAVYPVGRMVNSPRVDNPDIARPLSG